MILDIMIQSLLLTTDHSKCTQHIEIHDSVRFYMRILLLYQ